jgi:stage II sporulation protein D
MYKKIIQHYPCSRREFIVASGLFVAGGLVSCRSEEIERPKTRVFTEPIHIRVRIGKNLQRVTIGDNIFTHTSVGNTPKTIELKPNTKITIAEKTKTISGTIVLHPKENVVDTFDVVAHIPIEKYLPGVIAGELFAHWHPATFSAQAVAARSYAASSHLDRQGKSHYDLTDGPSSQMFLGEVALEVAHRAVEETKGVVLHYNNNIIPAYYSSCCGGLAANATDAISLSEQHKIPPLQGHSGEDLCTSLDIHKWKANRSARLLRKRLNACAKPMNIPTLADIRTIRSIESVEKNQHGRPTQLVIRGRRNETHEVRARDFVRAANATIPSLPKTKGRVWSSFLNGEKNGSNLSITGFGMGHGVGLCQYGAQELAGRGETWEDILSWYYPKATLLAQSQLGSEPSWL